jgi:hypothetical protein
LPVSLRISEQIWLIESKFGLPQNVAYRTAAQNLRFISNFDRAI